MFPTRAFRPTPSNCLDRAGIGASISYNFTKYLGLEGNFGGDVNRTGNVRSLMVGPKLTYRGDNVNYFVHTLFGWERVGARTTVILPAKASARFSAAVWTQALETVYLRVFEADFQWAHEIFRRKCP